MRKEYFFWLEVYSAAIRIAVRKTSKRTRIPRNPLRRGLTTKKHKSETSRKRNLSLKQAWIKELKDLLTISLLPDVYSARSGSLFTSYSQH